jgi:hypothetical protein
MKQKQLKQEKKIKVHSFLVIQARQDYSDAV